MRIQRIGIIGLLSVVFMTGCQNKPKTVEYFYTHPVEVQAEAKRCVNDAQHYRDITKDVTCMNIVAYERERCLKSASVLGMPPDCDSGPRMMSLAYAGY